MSSAARTVAETGEPLCIVEQAAHDTGRAVGIAAGLLIGGATASQGALSQLGSGLNLIEQAARSGADPATVAAYATRFQHETAALLARLVAIRVNATDSREAA